MENIKGIREGDFLSHLKTKEAIQEYFGDSKKFIEDACEITLSNIEALGLRQITEQVLRETVELQTTASSSKVESLSTINPHNEIVARFFHEFYNLSPQNLEDLYTNDGDKFKEFFRRRQETLHHDKEID